MDCRHAERYPCVIAKARQLPGQESFMGLPLFGKAAQRSAIVALLASGANLFADLVRLFAASRVMPVRYKYSLCIDKAGIHVY
jgi:hypothetical protein